MQRISGYVQQGNIVVVTGGVSSTTVVEGSYPGSTVSVFNQGTLVLASIFSDNIGTPKSNPFTSSSSDGSFFFYGANGRVDVQFSGTGIASPFTIGDILLDDPATTTVTSTTVAFNANPTFNLLNASWFIMTLTGNVTGPIFSNALAGDVLYMTLIQDGTGGRTFAWPVAFLNPPAPNPTASLRSDFTFLFDGTNWRHFSSGDSASFNQPVTMASTLTVAGATTLNGGVLNGSFTGSPTVNALTVTGAATTGVLNNTVTVTAATAGADMGAKIATGIAALIAASPTGGIVDATSFQGTQVCASNPFAGLVYGVPGAPIKILLGVVTVQINVASAVWLINSQNVSLEGAGPWLTWITYTGSGAAAYVIGFDASSNAINGGFGVYGNHLSGVFVDGNTHVTNAVAFINNQRPVLRDVYGWGATNAGIYIQFSVTPTLYNCQVSVKNKTQTGLPNTQVPAFGIIFDSGTFGAGFGQTTDGTVIDPIMEGVGLGIYLKAASSMKIMGGTSETNTSTTAGLQVDAGSANNTIDGLDCESNTGTNDILDNGTSTILKNIIAISGGVNIGAGSINSRIEGGNISSITVSASANSPGGLWRLPINLNATRVWQGAANSGTIGWNSSGGGELNYFNNVFTTAGAEAHTWYSANSTNTAYNKQAFIDATGNFQLLRGKITGYGGLPTAGQGVAWVPAITSQKAETTTPDANVLTLTPQALAGTYRVSVVISVSAATAGVISWSLSWTDSNGTAQSNIVQNLTQIQPSGTAAPAQSFTTSAASNYSGSVDIDINNAAANIVVKWVGGGVTTAKMSAMIERII